MTIRCVVKWMNCWLTEGGGVLHAAASGIAAYALYEALTYSGESKWIAAVWATLSIWVSRHLRRTRARKGALVLFWGLRGSVTMSSAILDNSPTHGLALIQRVAFLVFLTLMLEVSIHASRVLFSGRQLIDPHESITIRLGKGPHHWLLFSHDISYADGTVEDLRADLFYRGDEFHRNLIFNAGRHGEFRIFADETGELKMVLQNRSNSVAHVQLEISKT